ncbi:MAG: DUF6179 domain-containing protein [Lachnospiraceae bacterium]
MDYEMNELLPIVANLAEKYTAGQSTSVTYERAQKLMEAVIYCIEEFEKTEGIKAEKIPAQMAYEIGYEKILEETREVKEEYDAMIKTFQAYGNKNYYDTVTKAIPGFFLYYDARFAPQETIITMDYPTLLPVFGKAGIRAVEKYVKYISLEQKFLSGLPEVYVRRTLKSYCRDYEEHFFNICSIVLRDIMICLLMKKKVGEPIEESEYEKFKADVNKKSIDELEKSLKQLLQWLINEKYEGDRMLCLYLSGDMRDFAVWLKECMSFQNMM